MVKSFETPAQANIPAGLQPYFQEWEALTTETRNAFHLVSELPFIQRFYLAVGTGLALHLGHRFSVDLDFFSPDNDAVGPVERAILRDTRKNPLLQSRMTRI